MKKICWEESFHILHGRDVILAMVTGTPEQFELVQEALDRWWGPLMQFHGKPIPSAEDPMYLWRIKSQGNEEARQQFLEGYVPQIWELGLTVPDPKLRKRDDGVWEYTEPDWAELKHVVTGQGPKTEERLARRRGLLDRAERDRARARRLFAPLRRSRRPGLRPQPRGLPLRTARRAPPARMGARDRAALAVRGRRRDPDHGAQGRFRGGGRGPRGE